MEKTKKLDENFSGRKCISCGKVMEKDWKYCPSCKKKNNTVRCQFCNKEIENVWNYCPFCKSNLKAGKISKEYFHRGNEWLRQQLEE